MKKKLSKIQLKKTLLEWRDEAFAYRDECIRLKKYIEIYCPGIKFLGLKKLDDTRPYHTFGSFTRILIEIGIKPEDISLCLSWAFGEGYEYMKMRKVAERWNQLHGDLFLIKGSDRIAVGFEKIGRAYLEKYGGR